MDSAIVETVAVVVFVMLVGHLRFIGRRGIDKGKVQPGVGKRSAVMHASKVVGLATGSCARSAAWCVGWIFPSWLLALRRCVCVLVNGWQCMSCAFGHGQTARMMVVVQHRYY